MKTYEIKNNQLVINYGTNQHGNACTPTDKTGLQYQVHTPTTGYQRTNWSLVEDTEGNLRREREFQEHLAELNRQARILREQRKLSYKIKRFFGII